MVSRKRIKNVCSLLVIWVLKKLNDNMEFQLSKVLQHQWKIHNNFTTCALNWLKTSNLTIENSVSEINFTTQEPEIINQFIKWVRVVPFQPSSQESQSSSQSTFHEIWHSHLSKATNFKWKISNRVIKMINKINSKLAAKKKYSNTEN